MSYRFTLQADARLLTEHFGVTQLLAYIESEREYAPTGYVSAICGRGQERVLDEFRWGLLPFWARNAVHADGLSILGNKSFDYLLKRQRCVIPCSAYYRHVPEQGRKKAERVLLLQGQPLALAGVYDIRISPQGEELRTCTILSVTSAAPGRDEQVPIVLGPEQTEAWLSAEFMDKLGVRDMVETIVDAQPRNLTYPYGEPAAEEGEGLQPFPA
ncbi:SOS response-associated peptidase [Paenibacillus hodogayensis]|uniref:Abasic site processing protein n=1 Tax=Paenibacillus hodogayensis TaxID=279208 RepID=A0ABV5VSS4_9BACL